MIITKYKKLIKKHKKLFLLLIFVGLLIQPKSVQAITTIFELATNQLDALDFVDNVVLQIIIWLGLMATESAVFMYSTAQILQWAINFPIILGIGDPTKNPLVYGGWHFISGLANLCFALLFAITALAYILKIELFKAEKVLPKLIITALLINFSLVFVGFFVDISNLIQRAIINVFGAGDLVALAVEPLKTNLLACATMFLAIPSAYLVAMWIPYANVISLVAIAVFLLTEAIFGSASKTIILILFNLVIGGIFLKYTWRFISRVAMIYILAILSPLAFVSRIFEGEENKYYKEWLKLLISWCTLGIHMLFFLGLGLKLITNIPLSPFTVGGFAFPTFLYNYIFLLVYLAVASNYIDKYNPENVDFIMKQGQSLIGNVGKITQGFRERNMNKFLIDDKARQAEYSTKILNSQGKGLSTRETLDRSLGMAVATPTRWAMRTFANTTPEQEIEKITKETQGKIQSLTSDQLDDMIYAGLNKNIKLGRKMPEVIGDILTSQVATKEGLKEALIQRAKSGKISDLLNKSTSEDKVKIEGALIDAYSSIYKDKKREADASAIAMVSPRTIQEAIKTKFPDQVKNIGKLKEIIKEYEGILLNPNLHLDNNIKDFVWDKVESTKKESKTNYQQLFNQIANGIPDDQIKNLNKKLLSEENGVEWLLGKNNRLSEAAKAFGSDVVDAIQENVKKKSSTKNAFFDFAKSNPEVVNYLNSSAARNLGFGLESTDWEEDPYAYKKYDKGAKKEIEIPVKDITKSKEVMSAFMKEAFEKREKPVNVIDIEKKSAVPQAGPWMSEELLRNITKANDNAAVIKKQADTLHVLQKDWERNNEMMNELVKNDKRTADQVKYLDKLKQEIMPSLDKQLKTTIGALGSLEAKQQKSMEEIKQEIKSEKSEEDKFLTAKLLEKKSKDLDSLKTENFKIFKKEKEAD